MFLRRLSILAVFACILSASVMSHADEGLYGKRWGVRFGSGVGYNLLSGMPEPGSTPPAGTSGDSSASAIADMIKNLLNPQGITVPLSAEGTYAVTNAFELILGVDGRMVFAKDKTAMAGYANLGFRYYFNVAEPVKYYMSHSVASSLTQLALGVKCASGFQWDVTNNWGVFAEVGGSALATLSGSLKVDATPMFGLGAHYHF